MWVKIDDRFATHPKVVAAGPLAALLQIRAICYCSQNQTDGFLPRGIVPMLTYDLGEPKDGDWPIHMVQVQLWEFHADGYIVHDYLQWNLSKHDLKCIKEAQSKGGRKAMKSRWKERKQDDNSTYNSTNKSVVSMQSISMSKISSPNSSPEFDSFWSAYPQKVGKLEAQRAWKKAQRPALDIILSAIERAKKSQKWIDGIIPNPATWINQGRWLDQPAQHNGSGAAQAKRPPFPGPEDPIGRNLWRQAYGNPD